MKTIKRTIFLLAFTFLMGLLSNLLDTRPAMAVTLPDGFEHGLVTSVPEPTALAFTPDGRLLIASRDGQLRVYEDGQQSTALDIENKSCFDQGRGLVGLAVDPNFGTINRYIYLYYTAKVGEACEGGGLGDEVNRVSRFILSDDNTVDPAREMKLIDNIPSPGIHNGGDLHFGKDGYLYVSTGDGGCHYAEPTKCQVENDAARERNILLGKVLRIGRGGGIPSTNPFTGPDSARCNVTGRTTTAENCQETFAMGLRNPFRMAFDPDAAGTRFYINDVGGAHWEEINEGRAGADYGWNVREGHCESGSSTRCGPPPPGMTNPIHDYSRVNGCSAITGGAFVPDGAFSPDYNTSYLYADWVCNKIFKLTPEDGGGFTKTVFARELGPGGPISMTFGPYGAGKALYYTTFDGGGEVRRIAFTEGNRKPVAVAEGDPRNWSNNLTINLTGAKSSDPDGDRLTYEWDFTSDGTVDATDATVAHTYPSPGRYTATLRVRDARGALSDPDTIEVFPGNTPPDPVILSPAPEKLFKVGESITLRGSAVDPQDGQLANGALSWKVLQHHNGTHTHPYFSGTGNDLTFTAPAPEELLSTAPTKNYLEIRLTATDSLGLSRTRTLALRPKTVELTFASQPTEFKLEVNGTRFRAPRTFRSWVGYKLNIFAPQQEHNGQTWVFLSWSDGRAARHTITTPSTPTTYTATFEPL